MILLVSPMCISRRSSLGHVDLLGQQHDLLLDAGGSSSTLASASRSVSFWRCHSMICGRCSRTFFTSTWIPARRCRSVP